MKFLFLLISLCIGFLLCSPLAKAQAPTIATAPPQPPTATGSGAAPGETTIFGPPTAAPTVPVPTISTAYPIYP